MQKNFHLWKGQTTYDIKGFINKCVNVSMAQQFYKEINYLSKIACITIENL